MLITASDLLLRASILLQDTTLTRWQTPELLDWLSDGQREYVRIKPDAYVRNVDFSLAAGATQARPADAVRLVDVPRNSGGTAIRVISRRLLDTQVRDWTSPARVNPVVVHYCWDPANPKFFDVYPPSPGGNVVELVYQAVPQALALNDTLVIEDSAGSALIDYMLFRALSKDTEFASNDPRATMHYNAFVSAATGRPQAPAQAGA